ncbi:hypothetical protein [Geomonas propionica]|uniref:Uncharacterized protein n=1 Tax=Geomonas propionica TaxID=2798582 RepID=A0ABS0YRX6_9BACT|nr:hypothetical protein [Geomonas propionica]MBJ6800492.1 hypothetical protein [Geomonas propionica]
MRNQAAVTAWFMYETSAGYGGVAQPAAGHHPLPQGGGASGGMTGFTAPGGTDSKRGLLSMEGVILDTKGGVTRAKIG